MLRSRRLPFLVLLIIGFALVPTMIWAQGSADWPVCGPVLNSWFIGPTFSIGWINHTGSFMVPEESGCPTLDNGSGWGFGLGISAAFSRVPGGNWSINPALLYEERPAKREDIRVGDAGMIGQTSNITYTLLNAEIMYRQQIARIGDVGIGIKVGPAFQYVLKGTILERELKESGTTICFDGDIPERNSTRFFAKGGLEVAIELGDQWNLTPGIFYEHGLSGVRTTQSDWKVHSLIFQMGLMIPMW